MAGQLVVSNENIVSDKYEVELEEDLTFEVKKHYTITAKFRFKKDGSEYLMKRIQELENKVKKLESINKILVTEEKLAEDWDNEYDDRWNNV